MRRAVGRTRRWLAHPLVDAVVACALTAGMTKLVWSYRVAGPLAFVPLAGLALFVITVVLVAYRIVDVIARRASGAALQHAAQIALLVVVNLALIAVLIVGIHVVVSAAWPALDLSPLFAALVAASVRGTAWVGGAGGVVAVVFAVFVATSRFARRVPALGAVDRLFTRSMLGVAVVYSAYVAVLMFDVMRTPQPAPTTARVVAVKHVDAPFGLGGIVWLEIESWWRPGTRDRIVLRHGVDDAGVWRLTPGRRLQVEAAPGPFGMPWIGSLLVDQEEDVPKLVAAMPTAEWPRKWLIGQLARSRRWPELIEQAREYHRYYPADREAMARVLFSLRSGGQLDAARALEAELGMAPPTRPAPTS